MSKPLPDPGEIVALVLDLDVSDARFEPLAESLSGREHARRRSFRDPGHGRRWATGRGLLPILPGHLSSKASVGNWTR